MSNELVRRLEVLSTDLKQSEVDEIVNKFTQQLWNSEYNWKQCRDIIVSSLLGWKRKEAKKISLGVPKYRSGIMRLKARTEKCLLEKCNWFKTRKSENTEEKGDNEKKEKKWGAL